MWKKILLGLLVFVGLLVALVFWATSGMSGAADDFFNLLAQKNYTTAYNEYISSDFKAKTPLSKFINYVKANRFDEVETTNWGNRQINGNLGELEGSLVTKDGSAIPIKLKFVKANDNWQIYAISKPQSGISSDSNKNTAQSKVSDYVYKKPSNLEIPSNQEILALTTDSMQHFSYSVKAKNMQEFYDNISEMWKRQTSLDELNRVFKRAMDANIDLTPLIDTTPKIRDVEITPDGVLKVNVIYNGEAINMPGIKIEIDTTYVNEDGKWKLLGFTLRVKKKV